MNIVQSAGFASAVMLATGGAQFVESHNVSLPTVCSVGMIVLIGAWRLSSRFQSIDDRLTRLDEKVSGLWCQSNKGENPHENKKHEHET